MLTMTLGAPLDAGVVPVEGAAGLDDEPPQFHRNNALAMAKADPDKSGDRMLSSSRVSERFSLVRASEIPAINVLFAVT
jgi:hypothetical protein